MIYSYVARDATITENQIDTRNRIKKRAVVAVNGLNNYLPSARSIVSVVREYQWTLDKGTHQIDLPFSEGDSDCFWSLGGLEHHSG